MCKYIFTKVTDDTIKKSPFLQKKDFDHRRFLVNFSTVSNYDLLGRRASSGSVTLNLQKKNRDFGVKIVTFLLLNILGVKIVFITHFVCISYFCILGAKIVTTQVILNYFGVKIVTILIYAKKKC